jgi:putative ABC transport system permease protein
MLGAMLAEAWSALVANRLRSILTMLGMIIGVAAVILMLAIGSGVQVYIERQISSLGSNLLIISSGAARTGGGFAQGIGTAPTLTLDDADAIARLPTVVAAAPQSGFGAQVTAGPANWLTQVSTSTPSWFQVQDWYPDEGRAFTDMENRQAARVAVIGRTVADELFGANDPLGQQIRVRGVTFTVIGILPKRGQGIGGSNRDDTIVLPLNSAQRLVQGGGAFRRSVRTISVSVATPKRWCPRKTRSASCCAAVTSCPPPRRMISPSPTSPRSATRSPKPPARSRFCWAPSAASASWSAESGS